MMRSRIALSFAGVALAIAAIARDDRRIGWAAIVVLALSLALRLARRRKHEGGAGEP